MSGAAVSNPAAASGAGASLTAGLILGDRYALERELGRGAMGRVFAARDRRLGRAVAVKVLVEGLHTEKDFQRFRAEALAIGAVAHENILAVFDTGSHNGSPYLVSELLEGETLRARMLRGRLAPDEALGFAAQLVAGLCAAHGKGVVHRDLKPENLFVTPAGRLKILDFGIARRTQPADAPLPATRLTEKGAPVGTLNYMSPEQVRGEDADARSDLFAVGQILYELLSGARPFLGESAFEIGYAIRQLAPLPLPAEVPAGVAAVVERCLQKEPARRFQSAAELASALGAARSGEYTPLATPAARPARSERALVLAGLLLLFATAGVVALARARKPAAARVVAVLPFVDLSAAADAPLAEAVARDLRDALGRAPGVALAPRDAAGWLLQGTVRRSAGRLRVSAKLVTAADGAPRWSTVVERPDSDLRAVEAELERAVLAALSATTRP